MATRILPPEEYYKLEPIVKKLFGEDKLPPTPDMCLCVAVEERHGEIIGFLPLQLIPHLEPFGSLGGASFGELRQEVDKFVSAAGSISYYAHFDNNPKGELIALNNGFNPVGMLYCGISKG